MIITNSDNVIDSRDVLARIEDLTCMTSGDDFDQEYLDELRELQALEEQGKGYGDWDHGAALIHEGHFTEYIREMYLDGFLPDDFPEWIVVDWEATAQLAKEDYTILDFGDSTYFMLS